MKQNHMIKQICHFTGLYNDSCRISGSLREGTFDEEEEEFEEEEEVPQFDREQLIEKYHVC